MTSYNMAAGLSTYLDKFWRRMYQIPSSDDWLIISTVLELSQGLTQAQHPPLCCFPDLDLKYLNQLSASCLGVEM